MFRLAPKVFGMPLLLCESVLDRFPVPWWLVGRSAMVSPGIAEVAGRNDVVGGVGATFLPGDQVFGGTSARPRDESRCRK